MSGGLLDTSVLIAGETGRPLGLTTLPDELYISVITLAELRVGVLAAADTTTRARRLSTLESVAHLDALPVDATAARHWADLRTRLAEAGRRVDVNDLWIAAIAAASNLVVVTRDDDFDVISSVGGPAVVRV